MITKKDIGKRVIVNGEITGMIFKNEAGKIISVNDCSVGVEFDKKNPKLHDCHGFGKIDHCWYVMKRHITFEKESKKMTGIRIETEKIVEGNGNLSRKITAAEMLTNGKLPEKYVRGEKPVVYLDDNIYIKCRYFDGNELRSFIVGNTYPENMIQKLIHHCQKAGDHLMDVNRELRQKKAAWNGKETFVI